LGRLPAVDAAVEQRTDVRAARARVAAAQASRDLARAGRTRDVTVGVQFEHYPASAANPQGSGNSVGVAVQVPLFVRYAQQGEIRGAEAALDAATENLDKVRQAARADVAGARAKADAAARRAVRYDRDILPATRRAADDAEFAFAHGALGVMDVLDVRRAWRAAQLDALAARADLAKALAALDAALSPSFHSPSPQP
jgi:cobalt-zinc-cadmium efflux system outer membrane protein